MLLNGFIGYFNLKQLEVVVNGERLPVTDEELKAGSIFSVKAVRGIEAVLKQ